MNLFEFNSFFSSGTENQRNSFILLKRVLSVKPIMRKAGFERISTPDNSAHFVIKQIFNFQQQ